MTNEELLGEVSNLMDSLTKRFEDHAESLTNRFEDRVESLTNRFEDRLESLTNRFEDRLEAQTTKINLKIENDVSRRIEALFDGYKLTHEKQWELERNLMALEKRIEQLEIKVS